MNDCWKPYFLSHHTSTLELADMASKAKPKLLILYHIVALGVSNAELLKEINAKYKGKVIIGADLAVFD